MLRSLLAWSGLFAFMCAGMAQQRKADSIERLLHGNMSLSDRALNMKNLARYYEVIDAKRSIDLYNAARHFAERNHLDYETAVILHNKSFILSSTGDYSGAISVLDSALLFLEKVRGPQKDSALPLFYQAMGIGYQYSNDYINAVTYTIRAIEGYEKLKMYPRLIHEYYNLNTLYKQMNEPEKELMWAERTLATAREWGGKEGFFLGWFMKAYAHTSLHVYDSARIERDSSLRYYDPAYNMEARIAYHLISGLIYMNSGILDSAQKDFESSLAIAEENRNLYSTVQSRLQLARVLTLQKKFVAAEKSLQTAERQIAKSNENAQKGILLQYYSQLYEDWGKFKEALLYHKRFKELGDSVASFENRKYISEMETKYGTDKKDAEIRIQKALIRQKEFVNYLLGAGAFIISMAAFLIFRTYRERQKFQRRRIGELEMEKQLTATESVLKGEEQERIRLAKDLHDGLGGMLSGIKYSLKNMKGHLVMTPDNAQAFERSMDMLDSSIREMRRVAHNMMPDTLIREGLDSALRDFCNDINQTGVLLVTYQSIGLEDKGLDQTTAITIYRIVQELINNVIKHSGGKTAIVQVSEREGQLTVTVEDDGKGFDPSILERPNGIGLSNIRHRVDFLKGKMDIWSQPSKGTSIHIEFGL